MRRQVGICCIALALFFLCAALTAAAPNNRIAKIQQELTQIEQQLQPLEQQLAEYRKKALNEEMEAQPLMFDNWEEYSAKLRSMEEDEKAIAKLRKQIFELKKQRDKLEQELTTLSPRNMLSCH